MYVCKCIIIWKHFWFVILFRLWVARSPVTVSVHDRDQPRCDRIVERPVPLSVWQGSCDYIGVVARIFKSRWHNRNSTEGRLEDTRQSRVSQWCTMVTAAGWTRPHTLRMWQPLMDGRTKRNSCGCGYNRSNRQRPHLSGYLKRQVMPGA